MQNDIMSLGVWHARQPTHTRSHACVLSCFAFSSQIFRDKRDCSQSSYTSAYTLTLVVFYTPQWRYTLREFTGSFANVQHNACEKSQTLKPQHRSYYGHYRSP